MGAGVVSGEEAVSEAEYRDLRLDWDDDRPVDLYLVRRARHVPARELASGGVRFWLGHAAASRS
jgi:hypothetical protein